MNIVLTVTAFFLAGSATASLFFIQNELARITRALRDHNTDYRNNHRDRTQY